MAKSIADVVLESFPAGAAEPTGLRESLSLFNTTAGELPGAVSGLAGAIAELTRASDAQSGAASAVTKAVSSASGQSDGGISVGGVVKTVLENGLGLAPLARGLIGLFTGGGDEPAATPVVKYQRPASIQLEAALWNGEVAAADRDQSGAVRRYVQSTAAASVAPSATTSEPTAPAAQATQVVNVTVQAMDSRSFLDHSQEIARAVREAMLSMNSINDVVSEL